jgi:hypothetical protein
MSSNVPLSTAPARPSPFSPADDRIVGMNRCNSARVEADIYFVLDDSQSTENLREQGRNDTRPQRNVLFGFVCRHR